MKQPLLSIIIPIYNLEKYITTCLDSIIAQRREDIEIVLINDGSTDKSEEICLEYSNKYKQIKYFYQQNAGVSVARNNGLRNASGQYILFIDGDDWILNFTIEQLINKIKENPNIEIISGDFLKFFDGKIEEKKKKEIFNISKYQYPENLVKLFETNRINLSLCCNVFKKSLFLENNIYLEENVKYTEDMDCALRLFLKAKIIDIFDSPFYVYRQIKSSATHFYSIKRVEDIMNFVIKWDKIIESIEHKELKEYLNGFIQYEYSIVIGMLFLLDKKDRRLLYDKVKKYKKLLRNGRGKKGKLVYYCYKLFRFNITGSLMGFWIKYKDKFKA